MKKLLFSLLAIFVFTSLVSAQQNFSRVKINLGEKGLSQLSELGIDITEGKYKKDVFFITDLSEYEIQRLDQQSVNYKILIEDVSKFYAERAIADMPASIERDVNDIWPVPNNWEMGSMGGFYTLEEVMRELDDMAEMYPDIISVRQAISDDNLTVEGRSMFWVKISDNPNIDEDEPEILYSGVHHAREPMSVQQLIFYMWHLLENYDTDSDIQLLIDNTEMYFVPVVNPDGYKWNHTTYPMGGGMWRKNRRDNGDDSFGVDPNRNYGHMWGYDNQGSSPDTWDETYRGPSPFSETETMNMRDFSNAHDFKIALNYHSYSNLLLYAWGWTAEPSPDDAIFYEFASLMTQENAYTIGPASTTIYPTNGDSNDWMYGEQDSKDKIYAFVPEVGGDSDGFWPSTSRIVPLCQENMWQNISAAKLVGKYATLTETTALITNNVSGEIVYDIKRLGLTDAEEFVVSLTALDDVIIAVGENDSFLNMDLMQTLTDSIQYTLDASIEEGTEFKFLISVNNGLFSTSDTITKIFGTPVTVFIDQGETIENWTSSLWQVTNEDSHSLLNSITDSKNTDYDKEENNIINLETTIDLTDVSMAFLNFWAKWEIETGWDYVQLMVRAEGDASWTILEGNHTKKSANENVSGDEPYYDGFTEWVYEEIDISDFTGKLINFRFVLTSDSYVEEDGFYFDDFTVSVLSTATSINDNRTNDIVLSNAYPNPANTQFSISYNTATSTSNGVIQLFNSYGSMIKSFELTESVGVKVIDVSSLADGIYYYNINLNGLQSESKKLIKINR